MKLKPDVRKLNDCMDGAFGATILNEAGPILANLNKNNEFRSIKSQYIISGFSRESYPGDYVSIHLSGPLVACDELMITMRSP